MSGKTRIYDLAKDLGVDSNQVIAICESLGIRNKSHQSSLDKEEADQVRLYEDRFNRLIIWHALDELGRYLWRECSKKWEKERGEKL